MKAGSARRSGKLSKREAPGRKCQPEGYQEAALVRRRLKRKKKRRKWRRLSVAGLANGSSSWQMAAAGETGSKAFSAWRYRKLPKEKTKFTKKQKKWRPSAATLLEENNAAVC
jgi:hypothetical protein